MVPDLDDFDKRRKYSLCISGNSCSGAGRAYPCSYLVEEHGLLPENHFGARKQRSAEQALLLLTDRIQQARRKCRVLSLISFDVKGAYNGVNKDVLLARLRGRQIPEELVGWIEDFCSDRRASIEVNGRTGTEQMMAFPGLPQGVVSEQHVTRWRICL